MEVFSTITSPVFSELIIVFVDHVAYFCQNTTFFNALHAMNEVRPFNSVFLFEVSDPPRWRVLQGSAEALELMVATGTFDFLSSPPTVCIARSHHYGGPPKIW